jgi:hypothetical protein
MKIPDQKPFGKTKDSWSRAGERSKTTGRFLENYEEAFSSRSRNPGHTKFVYKNGKRYELPNPSTHGPEAQKAWDQFNEETGGLHMKMEKI